MIKNLTLQFLFIFEIFFRFFSHIYLSMIFHPLFFYQMHFVFLVYLFPHMDFFNIINSLVEDFTELELTFNDECKSISLYFIMLGV